MTRFTWQPIGDRFPVEVKLFSRRGEATVVCKSDDVSLTGQLGTVFQTPDRGWHFARHGVIETRGSQLCDHSAAVSALLFALREEGKV